MILKPHKFMNPDVSVLHISSAILQAFKNRPFFQYDELFEKITKNKSKQINGQIKYNYPYSLSLLFLLGKIRYDKKSDTIRFIK